MSAQCRSVLLEDISLQTPPHAQLCSLFSCTFLASLYEVYFDNLFHVGCQNDKGVRVISGQTLKPNFINLRILDSTLLQQKHTGEFKSQEKKKKKK